MSGGGNETKNRNVWIPVLMGVLFLGPLSLATYLYYTNGWRPAAKSHHELTLTAARPARAFAFCGALEFFEKTRRSHFCRVDIVFVGLYNHCVFQILEEE